MLPISKRNSRKDYIIKIFIWPECLLRKQKYFLEISLYFLTQRTQRNSHPDGATILLFAKTPKGLNINRNANNIDHNPSGVEY